MTATICRLPWLISRVCMGGCLNAGLITEESNASQYRFQDIIDLATGQVLATIEHEVRSMRHPLFARALVNRSHDAVL